MRSLHPFSTLDTVHVQKIPGSLCLHNFIVCVPEQGTLGMRLCLHKAACSFLKCAISTTYSKQLCHHSVWLLVAAVEDIPVPDQPCFFKEWFLHSEKMRSFKPQCVPCQSYKPVASSQIGCGFGFLSRQLNWRPMYWIFWFRQWSSAVGCHHHLLPVGTTSHLCLDSWYHSP